MSRPGTTRPGGRTGRTRELVFDATLDELASRAWEQVTIETIAAHAGVHKTTVYRRWGTKEQLVVEALGAAAHQQIPVPDSGDIDADLRKLAQGVRSVLVSREGSATVRALAAGGQSSPEVGRVIRTFWAVRMARVAPIVELAMARGQLPAGTDATELMKQLAAPLFHRLLVTAEPLTKATADRAAAAALAAARAGVFASARHAPTMHQSHLM